MSELRPKCVVTKEARVYVERCLMGVKEADDIVRAALARIRETKDDLSGLTDLIESYSETCWGVQGFSALAAQVKQDSGLSVSFTPSPGGPKFCVSKEKDSTLLPAAAGSLIAFLVVHFYALRLVPPTLKLMTVEQKEPSPSQRPPEFFHYMWLVVNTSLKKMKAGKIGAQCGHGVSYWVERLCGSQDPDYLQWKLHREPKIVLGASESVLQALIAKYEPAGLVITVRDAGCTQIPPNSLTVVAFKPMHVSKKPAELNDKETVRLL